MTYEEILKRQAQLLPKSINWWPNFFYHFTDIHNAVNILSDGWIMSREKIKNTNRMINDNASRMVIDATINENKKYARLYFRPLTPTQYHNEGYKPKILRQLEADCPVPVFFCLNSAQILNYPGTKFAEKGLAGGRHNIKTGVDAFSELNFDKIYHDGWYDSSCDNDIKYYRLSEIINKKGFPLEPFLQCILCRSVAEKDMLLYLLQRRSKNLYEKYKKKIIFRPKLKCFNSNHTGIFIKEVYMDDSDLYIIFNDAEQRYTHEEGIIDFVVSIEISYLTDDKKIINTVYLSEQFNYTKIRGCEVDNLEIPEEAYFIRIKVTFDDCEMYKNEIYVPYSEFW